jgi:2-methylcitrate dehydratase PrpD
MATNGTQANGHRATLTRRTARRLHHIATAELSSELYDKAIFCIVDFLGAVHTGLLLPWKDSLVKYARLNAGKPEAYVWGIDDKVSVETAAFVNATLAHR